MMDVNDVNLNATLGEKKMSNKSIHLINSDVNVIPLVDLLFNYNTSYETLFKYNVDNLNRNINDHKLWRSHVEVSYTRNEDWFLFENKENIFYSYAIVASISESLRGSVMDYSGLEQAFSGLRAQTKKYRSPNGNKIVVMPGMVYEINYVQHTIDILFCLVAKKEWIQDILLRNSLDLPLNPSSFGLIYDPRFDYKDYPYKGLRSFFRKHIKTPFVDDEIALEQEDIVGLFKKSIKTPSFLVEKEKEDWCSSIVQEFYENVI
jgi:hypothetical protein